jgi:hypothetical protein
MGSLLSCHILQNFGHDLLQASAPLPEATEDSLAEIGMLRRRLAAERGAIRPRGRDNDPVLRFEFAQ